MLPSAIDDGFQRPAPNIFNGGMALPHPRAQPTPNPIAVDSVAVDEHVRQMMLADPKLWTWVTEYGSGNVLALQASLTDGLRHGEWPHAIVISAVSDAALVLAIIPVSVVAWLAHQRGGYSSSSSLNAGEEHTFLYLLYFLYFFSSLQHLRSIAACIYICIYLPIF